MRILEQIAATVYDRMLVTPGFKLGESVPAPFFNALTLSQRRNWLLLTKIFIEEIAKD